MLGIGKVNRHRVRYYKIRKNETDMIVVTVGLARAMRYEVLGTERVS